MELKFSIERIREAAVNRGQRRASRACERKPLNIPLGIYSQVAL